MSFGGKGAGALDLVSACLAGLRCRFDGDSSPLPEIEDLVRGGLALPVCPEQLGGLPTPRSRAEIVGGTGKDVLEGRARVIDSRGRDVTDNFLRGAEEAWKLARLAGAKRAFLKDKSPSCGVTAIHAGSFRGELRSGPGVTAALLESRGLAVLPEREARWALSCGTDRLSYIGVVGAGECSPPVWALAENVGRELARRGAVLICGGLGGVMAAAAKGVREAGGMAVGILPGVSRDGANPYLSASVVTGMGEGRNFLVVRSSDAVIAISGGFGTLSEIALALRIGVPVVGLNTWKAESEAGRPAPIIYVGSPEEAVEVALREAGHRTFPGSF